MNEKCVNVIGGGEGGSHCPGGHAVLPILMGSCNFTTFNGDHAILPLLMGIKPLPSSSAGWLTWLESVNSKQMT